jgi:hypothetical protein
MTWLRSSGPKPDTRYSFTVNFQTHPELEPLAHHLWSLPPAPTSRNHAILKILQAGFQVLLLQGSDQAFPSPASSPPVAAPVLPSLLLPAAAGVRPSPTSPNPPRALSQSALVASLPHGRNHPGQPVTDGTGDALSPAASRFLTQFDD